MPHINGVDLTPDEAIAKGLCPECGRDLRQVNPIAELNSHWKAYPVFNQDGMEALRRMQLLKDFIEANGVRTSNMPRPKAPNAAPAE